MRNRSYHFSIGVVNVSLRSNCRMFVNEFLSLYQPYRRRNPDRDTIEVELKPRHRFPWRRGPYTLHSDRGQDFQVEHWYEVLPHLEWFINWQIIRNRHDYLQLHASSLEMDGRALILPGSPGRGKSTLTAGLLARGWSYLCDEFALVDPDTLMVHPFPRALCMKEASFDVVERLGLPLYRKTPYYKVTKGRVGFLNPLEIRADVVGKPSCVRWVVFPQYIPGATPTLEPMTRSQGAYALARQCFNFPVYEALAVDILTDVVRSADCYRLVSGEIGKTCDLLDDLTGG